MIIMVMCNQVEVDLRMDYLLAHQAAFLLWIKKNVMEIHLLINFLHDIFKNNKCFQNATI